MPVGKSGCEWSLANCVSPTASIHFLAFLSNYNGMTAYIYRRFIPTTAFLVASCVPALSGCSQSVRSRSMWRHAWTGSQQASSVHFSSGFVAAM